MTSFFPVFYKFTTRSAISLVYRYSLFHSLRSAKYNRCSCVLVRDLTRGIQDPIFLTVVLPIFTPNTLLERACFELNENVLVLKMKQGTVKWQGFKVGHNVGFAAPDRERTGNVGGR